MFGAGLRRGQQGEQQVHRLTVDRVEIHWRFQTQKHRADTAKPGQAGMRYGHARTDAGRTGLSRA